MRHISKKTDLDLWFNDPIFAVLYSAIFFKLLVNELPMVNQHVFSSISYKIDKKTATSEVVKLYRSFLILS